jgi:hypothetical protein
MLQMSAVTCCCSFNQILRFPQVMVLLISHQYKYFNLIEVKFCMNSVSRKLKPVLCEVYFIYVVFKDPVRPVCLAPIKKKIDA